MKINPHTLQRTKGFSLVEMLIVIGLIGFMASISIVYLSEQTKITQETTARANAKQFYLLASAASAAGNNPAANNSTVIQAMEKLKNGITISSGAFANREFKLPNISTQEITRAEYYLDIVNGDLTYLADKPNNPN
jgi:prepilin-type N-terminal cleavage/methylation domain-containing protein